LLPPEVVAHSKRVAAPAEEVEEVEAARLAQVEAGPGGVVEAEAVKMATETAEGVVAEASLEMPMVLPWHQQASPFH
jgi:hypothetical protein